jgi:thioredoxin-dependent peroxiredoxin
MNMLKVGDKAPQFSVFDEQSNLRTSESLNGSRYIVFFYPRANTPGCTAEACSLRDGYAFSKRRAINYLV